MSELAYRTYLNQMNTRLEIRDINLGLDFNVDNLHLIDQINIIDQYLYYNNILIRIGNKNGHRDLSGFESKTVIEWNNECNEKERKRQLERQIRNLLHLHKSYKNSEPILMFDSDTINIVTEDYDNIDIDLFSDIEQQEEIENIQTINFPTNPSSLPVDTFTYEENYVEQETEEDYISTEMEDTYMEEPYVEQDLDDEDTEDIPLIGDMYNDLVEAHKIMDETEEDEYGFTDEYAIYEDEEDNIDNETDFSGMEDSLEDKFDVEIPYTEDCGIESNLCSQSEYKREIRTADKVVDKTTDLVNQGINNLLKRLAGK